MLPKAFARTAGRRKKWPNVLQVPSFPPGKFSHFLACTGILRPVTPHRLALCPPLGQIVIFIYQLIAMLPALSPPSQETHVKWMKTGRQFHPSAAPSRTFLAGSLLVVLEGETPVSHFHTPKPGHLELLAIRLCYRFSFSSVTMLYPLSDTFGIVWAQLVKDEKSPLYFEDPLFPTHPSLFPPLLTTLVKSVEFSKAQISGSFSSSHFIY